MISVSNKKWSERFYEIKKIDKCSQDNNFSQILSKLVISRRFAEEEIYSINNPESIIFSNIFKFNSDFVHAVKLVNESINKNEKICIFGDYDVDGSCSTALLVKFFDSIKHPHFFYIPNREKDGYGLNINLVKKIIKKKPKLIIIVDNGSNSNEEINLFTKNKIKTLIIDHHQINKPFPRANVIINPKMDNGYIKHDYMCATLLTFFFIDLLKEKIKSNFILSNYLIYPLLATVCDVMPLRKVNRFLAIHTLNKFNFSNVNSIKNIFYLLNKKNKISIDDLGYVIGPILNAGGRFDNSDYAVKLLSSNNNEEIISITKNLINLNNKRKKLEDEVLTDIDYKNIEKEDKNVIVYYNHTIKEGIIGIIAARLKDKYNKPVIVITSSKNVLKGSARSVFGFDVGLGIKNAHDNNLILKGGGHKMAAGFTIEKNKLKLLDDFMNEYYKKVSNRLDIKSYYYDAKISGSAVNKIFFNEINKLKPFGTGNPNPLFLIEKLKIKKAKILNNKHISNLFVSKNGLFINAISFNAIKESFGKYLINYKKEINVIGYLSENFWNNKKKLQLVVRDLIL